MKYPIITFSDCSELTRQRLEIRSGWEEAVKDKTLWVGEGKEFNAVRVQDAAAKARQLIPESRQGSDPDRIEGQAAVHLYEVLQDTPVVVLDDRGLWRWLSLAHFWDFIAWREEKPFASGNHLKYLDCNNSSEAVLPRMYRRVAALGGAEHVHLAYAIPKGTDFWRSHVLRIKTATTPAMTRALVRFQAEHQLKTEEIRELAKRLRRVWANAVLEIYDDNEAAGLIAEQAEDLIEKSNASQ